MVGRRWAEGQFSSVSVSLVFMQMEVPPLQLANLFGRDLGAS